MHCWDILERRARIVRDQAAEALSEIRGKIQEQQGLLERTQAICHQYQEKIAGMQTSVSHFGDLQLYRSSLKQMQQAVFQFQNQIRLMDMEASRRQKQLAAAELERQKYVKLIEREARLAKATEAKADARTLDDIGTQLHHRRQKLA